MRAATLVIAVICTIVLGCVEPAAQEPVVAPVQAVDPDRAARDARSARVLANARETDRVAREAAQAARAAESAAREADRVREPAARKAGSPWAEAAARDAALEARTVPKPNPEAEPASKAISKGVSAETATRRSRDQKWLSEVIEEGGADEEAIRDAKRELENSNRRAEIEQGEASSSEEADFLFIRARCAQAGNQSDVACDALRDPQADLKLIRERCAESASDQNQTCVELSQREIARERRQEGERRSIRQRHELHCSRTSTRCAP